MTVEIVEVLERSRQGQTEPFICRADDDLTYFVKGKGAGRASLVKEYMCGRLAKILGLPIAPFAIVEVPRELIVPDTELQLEQLGHGPAFGSVAQALAREIRLPELGLIPPDIRRWVAVFDRWVRNYDRTLSASGGNPNVLWVEDRRAAILIDHNCAFDAPLSKGEFIDQHMFGRDFQECCLDGEQKAAFQAQLGKALARWDEIVGEIPPDWMFADAYHTVAINLSLNDERNALTEQQAGQLWV